MILINDHNRAPGPSQSPGFPKITAGHLKGVALHSTETERHLSFKATISAPKCCYRMYNLALASL